VSPRRVTGAVLGWLLVVTAASGLAWFAIDHAGRDVVAAVAPVSATSAAGRATPGTAGSAVSASGRPTVSSSPGDTSSAPAPAPTTGGPTATPSPGSSGTPRGPGGSGPHPTTGGGGGASSTSRTTSPGTPTPRSATTPPPPPSSVVDRSVQVAGGQVGARCAGATISLRYAQPADGWRVEVQGSGPEAVEVTFRSASGEQQVRAGCVNGTPSFSAATSNDPGGSGQDPAASDAGAPEGG
jgi:hypothetical protein